MKYAERKRLLMLFLFLGFFGMRLMGQQLFLQLESDGKWIPINLEAQHKVFSEGQKWKGKIVLVSDSLISVNGDTIPKSKIDSLKLVKFNQRKWGVIWLGLGGTIMIKSTHTISTQPDFGTYLVSAGSLVLASGIILTGSILITKRKKVMGSNWRLKLQ